MHRSYFYLVDTHLNVMNVIFNSDGKTWYALSVYNALPTDRISLFMIFDGLSFTSSLIEILMVLSTYHFFFSITILPKNLSFNSLRSIHGNLLNLTTCTSKWILSADELIIGHCWTYLDKKGLQKILMSLICAFKVVDKSGIPSKFVLRKLWADWLYSRQFRLKPTLCKVLWL